MSTINGANNHLVTSENVYAINLLQSVIIPEETGNIGLYGGYQVKCYHQANDCSTSGIFLELNDLIPWTNISCEFELGGVASCWGFNDNFGASPASGYLYAYNESLGDIIPFQRCLNSWEVPAYQTHSKTFACDNNVDNFFRYSDNPKTLLMRRRRDISVNRAGINHGRACKSAGVDSYTIIKNIYIW